MGQGLSADVKVRSFGDDVARVDPRPVEALKAFYQPIVNLQTGEIIGFEALARLVIDGVVVPPARFLPILNERELLSLFGRMVGMSLDFSSRLPSFGRAIYVSVNVEVGLLLADGFIDMLAHLLDLHEGLAGRLVLEILEGERIANAQAILAVLAHVKALGVGLALDDIGSAYSSLARIRELPVDIVKLDQVFARGLDRRPEDLAFIWSVAALARGLEKRLVVEGVETPEALDALTILGIETVQGYAVARPLPEDELEAWLKTRPVIGAHRRPQSMLGVYASHLTVVESCRSLATQPLQVEWKASAKDWQGCEIGRFFASQGLHDTCCGRAHIKFHEVLDLYDTDREEWEMAAKQFRAEIVSAILGKRLCT